VDEERIVTRSEHVETRAGYGAPLVPPAGGKVYAERSVAYRTNRGRTLERAVIFLFGLIQALLVLRIVLLLLAAREGNDLVALIYNFTDLLVAPFRGIFAIERVAEGQTALDVAAIVALVGWTLVELLVLGLLRVFRRDV
jgi:uncharacterized protein YggT (Ycf19 family)